MQYLTFGPPCIVYNNSKIWSFRYATDVVTTIRLLVLITVITCTVACVFAGINLIGKQPFAVKAQFLTVSGTALLEVLMCSLPADHLIDMSENIMQGIYESKWYERSLKIQKSTVLMLTPQSPVTVKIKCLIPVLSLNFYCSYVSNVFSLFTALRIVMIDDENGN
ncbi:PREDICTED: odorant receptor 49a-like [Habropoda laboriosa]|uniref:odorant receptor 49a-like n=1 Tax=Habropoda laboriosa TaxID=597456 RepID=UPI00083E07CE|nr:PREDICTED: odorant receptor 49a-like [Habropoda laboriosa]